MSNTKKNIDQLFLHKSFHELSEAEKMEIAEIAKTESEFNETKMMLTSIEKEINSIQDIEPKAATKTHLISEFNRIRPAKTSRPMGLGIFFPKEKPFHQKLGVQLLAIAAVVVLIFTVFIPGKEKLTQHGETAEISPKEFPKAETLINKEIIEPNTPLAKEELENEMDGTPIIIDQEDKQAEKALIEDKTIVTPAPPVPSYSDNKDYKLSTNKKDQNNIDANTVIIVDEIAEESDEFLNDSDFEAEDLAMEDVLKPSVATGNSNAEMTRNNYTDDASLAVTSSASETEKVSSSSAKRIETASKEISSVKTSKTLSENKELIKHFYTAM